MPDNDTIHLPSVTDWWQEVDQVRLAGRYLVQRQAGTGGGGIVYAALDEVTGDVVAAKLLHGPPDKRLAREIGALRRLDLPGVVHLRRVTEHEGRPLIVMDLVEGQPFPGPLPGGDPGTRWQALCSVLVALLEILDGVHQAGIVHRDLKPSNVLVDALGQPVLLDFGLARGRELGSTITRRGTVLGTPRYLSPEVLSGQRADGRADLYAVGVMLFESLAGRPPHGSDELAGLMRARLHADAPSLRLVCPGLPRAAADLVDGLLARDPDHRPPSARAVLDELGSGRSGERLPWLGSEAPVLRILGEAQAGRSATVGGAPGSGRSRVLREVAATLTEEGRIVSWAIPGGRPFESLLPLLPDVEQASDVAAAVRSGVRRILRRSVLIIDDRARLDRWSRGLLDQLEGQGVILQAVGPEHGATATLSRLAPQDLRALFWGPDRFLHLREDGAAALHARTLGVPARVEAVVSRWVAEGVCDWTEGRLGISRSALDRLALERETAPPVDAHVDLEPGLADTLQWVLLAGTSASADALASAMARPRWELELELAELERQGAVAVSDQALLPLARPGGTGPWTADRRHRAHLALVDALPVGSPARLHHLLAARDVERLAPEAVTAARTLWREGRLAQARALLAEAGAALVEGGAQEHLADVAGMSVRLAVAEGTLEALESAGSLAGSVGDPGVLAVLVAAARAPSVAIEELAKLGPLPDRDLEITRVSLMVQAAGKQGVDTLLSLHQELDRWVLAAHDPEAAAMREGWRGLLAYREGDFKRAVASHTVSLDGKATVTGRLSSLLNLASTLMEVGDLDGAVSRAEEACALAAEHRQPMYEARATWMARRAADRRGDVLEPETTWVDDAAALNEPSITGMAALTEAYVASGAGDAPRAIGLAKRAEETLIEAGNRPATLMARAMRVGLGDADAVWGQAEQRDAERAPARLRAELERLRTAAAAHQGVK